jgi:hypothetical protein
VSDPQTNPQTDPQTEPQIVPGTSRPIPVDPMPGDPHPGDPNLDPQTHPDPAEEAGTN